MTERNAMIYFRQVKEPHDAKFAVWYVEYRDERQGVLFPMGTAYVIHLLDKPQYVHLAYMFVGDQWRRQGIGTKLIDACKERWPAMQFTSPMDGKGEGLLRTATDYFEQLDEN
jgi:GNAT superfamily N-acetyltransferase